MLETLVRICSLHLVGNLVKGILDLEVVDNRGQSECPEVGIRECRSGSLKEGHESVGVIICRFECLLRLVGEESCRPQCIGVSALYGGSVLVLVVVVLAKSLRAADSELGINDRLCLLLDLFGKSHPAVVLLTIVFILVQSPAQFRFPLMSLA